MAKLPVKAAKGYKHAELFPDGEIIKSCDKKKEFVLEKLIGVGGFGLIYNAKLVGSATHESYAVKIEPIGNGPLFNEFHVLQRVARSNFTENYVKKNRMTRHLGVPNIIANGVHEYKNIKYRFVVLPKLGTDLQKIFENNGRYLDEKTVYSVAIQMLDVLEYLDHHGYVHADLKAANILLGTKSSTDKLYLIDYGLATKYTLGDKHKPYKKEKKNAHNGTLEYTSVDAHDGADPSRRGDLQILGFCLYEWLTGSLPWKSSLKNKELVKTKKESLFKDFTKIPIETLKSYFKVVGQLRYEDRPNYEQLRRLFQDSLKKIGKSKSEKLSIGLPNCSSPLKDISSNVTPIEKEAPKRKAVSKPKTRASKRVKH